MLKDNKKAQITFIFIFFVTAILIIVVTAFFAPMMVKFNTKMYEAGDNILANTQADLDAINDSVIRSQINDSIQEARSATLTNIDVGNDLYQYGWILVIVVTVIVIFLFTRQTVEFGGGFI